MGLFGRKKSGQPYPKVEGNYLNAGEIMLPDGTKKWKSSNATFMDVRKFPNHQLRMSTDPEYRRMFLQGRKHLP